MKSIKKLTDSSLASSNMVNIRRDEIERLEKRRLAITAKLEAEMRKYARVTGDRSVARRRRKLGKAPNDWSHKINASGIKRPLKVYEKIIIGVAILIGVVVVAEAFIINYNIDVSGLLKSLLDYIFVPANK